MDIFRRSESYSDNPQNRKSPRYEAEMRPKSAIFVPPSQAIRKYNCYIKQPFKQMQQPIVKPTFRSRQLPEVRQFMSLGRRTQISPSTKPYGRSYPHDDIDPATYLVDETAFAIFQLHRSLQQIPPATMGNPPQGHLRRGRLQVLRPIYPDGPTIKQCKGFVPDRRLKMPTSAVRRRGLLIAALEGSRYNQYDDIYEMSHPRVARPISQSIHQTSEASSDELEQLARIKILEEDVELTHEAEQRPFDEEDANDKEDKTEPEWETGDLTAETDVIKQPHLSDQSSSDI